MRFDEIFASAVSDRPSEQQFKKSNFGQLHSLFLSNLIFLGVTPTHFSAIALDLGHPQSVTVVFNNADGHR
jgi:hypothetical protein